MLAGLAAEHDLAALAAGALDERVHALLVRLRDQRAHLRLGVERVAHLHAAGLLAERVDEVVVDRLLDEDPRARLAALAGRVVDRPDRARDRRAEVGVREDEVGALAAELERQPLDRLGAEPHDLAAGLRRARERDLVDAGVPDEVGAGRRPVAGDDVDRAGRKADLGRELGEPQRGHRRLRVGLQDDGAAGGKRGRELPRRHQQRVVPRARSGRRRRPAPSACTRAASRRSDWSGRRSSRSRRRRSGSSRRRRRARPSSRRSPCRRSATRAPRAPCGSRRSRRRARAGGGSARSRASCPSRRRARRARPRRHGRSRPRPRAARCRAPRRTPARRGRGTRSPRPSRR